MDNRQKCWLGLVLCAGLLGLAGCSSSSRPETIRVAGSSTVLPVMVKAAEQFMASHEGVRVVVNAGGSGVGVNQLAAGSIDLGMASREVADDERKQNPAVHFVEHAIGRDAVVPVISSEVYEAGVQALSLAQLADIYRGNIRNWKELGGPDRDILVIDKEASRGTRHVFMEKVMGDKHARADGADLVLGSNNEEQTAITQSDAAIGMLSLAWMNKDVRGLAIRLPDGHTVSPTLAHVVDGSFPIVRNLNLLTNGPARGMVKALIDFVLSAQGQSLVSDSGYVALKSASR